MVLDVIVSASRQTLGYFCPLVAQLFVRMCHNSLFFLCPVVLVDARVQVVMPSLATLLAASTGNGKLFDDVLGNHRPALDSILVHQMANCLVLLRRPNSPTNVSIK